MYEIGNDVDGVRLRFDIVLLSGIWGRPTSFPSLIEEEVVVCDDGETFIVCESLKDMRELYDAYVYANNDDNRGIRWYRGKKVKGRVFVLVPKEGIVSTIIDRFGPHLSAKVKKTIMAYAKGNLGTARVLSERAKFWWSPRQVERLVGWPLDEHTSEASDKIWGRFKYIGDC